MTRFLESELPLLPPEACLFHVIPVPYEATVSYGGGTGKGPEAIIEASNQLEVWTGECNPGASGICTWPAVACDGDAQAVMDAIAAATRTSLDAGKPGAVIPVLLGGEHSITFGSLRAMRERYGEIGVIHFDAHADLRDTYEGSRHSHACVMRRAADDLGLPLFQIGIRSLSPEEVTFRQEKQIPHLDARDFARLGGLAWLREQGGLLPEGFPGRVFLTFDVDALDPGIMPATGTPEPGGLSWWESLALVRRCLEGRQCVGMDVTETAPIDGLTAPTFAAARLTYELMAEALIARRRDNARL